MPSELKLRIIVEQPPSGVDYALQKGTGSIYETVQRQRSDGNDLTFEFTPIIRAGVSDPMAALGGPFVQGPPKQRFVYLDIGSCAGQHDSSWSRRLKIPLMGIVPKMLTTGGVLEARVPGTGRDGGPSCATVKEFDGWKPVN
jgi:hypothetical protein